LLALAVLGPLDYLFLRGGDDTAWALVDPTIRTFVEQDRAQAGLLIHTLMAYVDCSLNVKLAAERLFVHPNTAHYRLSKIEEITGRDLRNLVELQDLVIAVRLARHLAAR
jgi:DNA-binding PucR family transcriptional regulator